MAAIPAYLQKNQREQLIIDAHPAYVEIVQAYVHRAKESLAILNAMGIGSVARIVTIENIIAHAERQIDQIRRRVIEGETIPHHEKVFSIFEEHTEWISKGKAGVPQELGLGVCVLEDQYGFILHHRVMEKQKDVEIAALMVAEAKRNFAALSCCSFYRGFYSPANKQELQEILDDVVLPKKGFKRYVALAVLARNIQILGAKLRQRSLEHQRRLDGLAA